MVDKKILKFFLISEILAMFVGIIIPLITSPSDSYSSLNFYALPIGDTNLQHSLFFYLLTLLTPFLALFFGYILAYFVVLLFCRLSKFSKRIEFIGYASLDRSPKYLKKRYIIQIIFAVLLCVNIWIALVGSEAIMEFWLNDAGLENMVGSEGQYYNFVFVPWYWLPIFITTLVFATCVVIMDSGLVSVKKLMGQTEFSDTERVGDKMFSIVKGYAGISVILSFILLLQSPRGNEMSLVFYPFQALIFILPFIFAMDLFRSLGIKWIFNATKRFYEPQMIKLNFEKTDISDYKDIMKQ